MRDITLFSEQYHKHKIKLVGHFIRSTDEDVTKACTFTPDLPRPLLNRVRRVGQPRLNWCCEALRSIWEGYADDLGIDGHEELNLDDRFHIQAINLAAHLRCF